MISQRSFGQLPTGESVDEFTLSNTRGVTLKLITYGGIVTQLHVPDRYGMTADVVLGFNRLDDYLAGHPYFGCITGRVAGRITQGKFSLDGREYLLAINNVPNHLHGGNVGLDKRLWRLKSQTASSVTLTYNSPDGEENYPGNVTIEVSYSLNERNEWTCDYTATADAPTPLSLTNHTYFNLAGEGSGSIKDHVLEIIADDYATTDSEMTLLDVREPVIEGGNDFRSPRRIGDAIPHLWQHHGDNYFLRPHTKIAARLTEPTSGRVMTIHTTEPCLQLYTGVSLNGSLNGKSGKHYEKHGALCLECQRYPNGANASQLGDIILKPGVTYCQTTTHAFSIE